MAVVNDQMTRNRALYLVWLRTNFPDLYRASVVNDGLSGILDSIGSAFNNLVKNVTDSLPQLANTYTQYQTQRQLIESNSQRAQQGLPPLVYQNGQLVPMTGGSYTAEDYRLASTAGFSTGTILMIAVAFGLGVLLLTRK
jgi:hypothetical protein